jgi:hypothetical protein
MQPTPQHLPPLAEYQDIKTAQETLGHFPTLDSLRWFIRRNRDQLADKGALILVAGRQKLHPGLTEEIVKETGRLAAIGGGGE